MKEKRGKMGSKLKSIGVLLVVVAIAIMGSSPILGRVPLPWLGGVWTVFGGCEAPTPAEVFPKIDEYLRCGVPFVGGAENDLQRYIIVRDGVPPNRELFVDCVFLRPVRQVFMSDATWCSGETTEGLKKIVTSISFSFPKDWGNEDALRFLQCFFPDRNWEEGLGENPPICYGEGSVIFRSVVMPG